MDSHKSLSTEQMNAEAHLFSLVEDHLCVKLKQNHRVYLRQDRKTFIQPDFYSKESRIIGEIYAHVGTPKVGQRHKISNDILKMILFERSTGVVFRKILVICDHEMEVFLTGSSFIAESIRQFGIEILCMELEQTMIGHICEAQKRQRMTNA